MRKNRETRSTGLEPAASAVTGRRSDQLSYDPSLITGFRMYFIQSMAIVRNVPTMSNARGVTNPGSAHYVSSIHVISHSSKVAGTMRNGYKTSMQEAASNAAPWTVARLLDWTRRHFQRQGIESPRLCAEILLAHALRCPRIQLYARHESVPDTDSLTVFRDAVREAAAGKPIAYLTGSKEFFSLSFDVTPDVLIPRPETEILVERAIDWVRKSGRENPAILDIGTGSGCVITALAKHLPAARCFASDASSAALAIAKQNANRHGIGDRIEFRHGDLFEPWSAAADGAPAAFDVIVSNPPYIAEREASELPRNVRDYEPATALFAGDDGLDVIRRLTADAPRFLAPGGLFLMEMAYNQSAAVRPLFSGANWKSVAVHRDTAGHLRVVQAHSHDGAQGGS